MFDLGNQPRPLPEKPRQIPSHRPNQLNPEINKKRHKPSSQPASAQGQQQEQFRPHTQKTSSLNVEHERDGKEVDRLLFEIRNRVRTEQQHDRSLLQRFHKNADLLLRFLLLHRTRREGRCREEVQLQGPPLRTQKEGESLQPLQGLPPARNRKHPYSPSHRHRLKKADLRSAVVPFETRSHLPPQQQISAGDLHRPE
jgi:hypothetical protein